MKKYKILESIHSALNDIYSEYGIGRFYTLKLLKGIVFYMLKSDYVEVEGHKLFLDSRNSMGLTIFKNHEPHETSLVKKKVKKGDVVLDIGANIGYFTLIFAKLVGEEGKVFSFEPDPTNFALLKKNIKINGYKNIIPIQKAVSNKTSKIKLHLSKSNYANHTIYDKKHNHKSIDVNVIKLDDYFNTYKGKIDFVKIDTEGVEEKVIKGMPNILNKNKNLKILSEFWVHGMDQAGIKPENFLKSLIKHNFEMYKVNEKLEQTNIKELLKIYTPKKGNYTTLYCYKKQ